MHYYEENIGNVLRNNNTKYVYLDLSGNTFTFIYSDVFRDCTSLTGITIPSSVTGIIGRAFYGCINLVSVTFQGTIASNGFDDYAFYEFGDLRAKFYATDAANGTPGTYTTTAPVSDSSVWTKQP
jgi:hypothetical protein